jgi:hypothetical protein
MHDIVPEYVPSEKWKSVIEKRKLKATAVGAGG